MTITEVETGSQTASISTEHTLNTFEDPITTDGVYQLYVDASAMVNGDELELRWYEKARAGDTARVVAFASFANVQGEPLLMSPPVEIMNGGKCTLKQTAGTGRAFLWSIRRIT